MSPTALFVLGNAMTSRIESSPANRATKRSKPKAIPPCGGAPYSSASSRKPNFFRGFFGCQCEQIEKLALNGALRYTNATPCDLVAVEDQIVSAGAGFLGSDCKRSTSSSRGDVNGW